MGASRLLFERRAMKFSSGWLFLVLAAAPGLCARSAESPAKHDKAFWREIVRNKYAVPQGEGAFPLAKELSGALASPDPELRDDLAYSILAAWIADRKNFSGDQLRSFAEDWTANLRAGIGENGQDSVFRRSFSALCLASLAERDLETPFLEPHGYRRLLERTLDYLVRERDLRGFDVSKGWIHATAHAADLLAALARNRLFAREDQAAALRAVADRLATAPVYAYGEQDRLAHAAAAIVDREDFDAQAFRAWLVEMDQADQLVWRDSPPRIDRLWRFENDSYFLRALVVETARRGDRPAACEVETLALRLLVRR
jgi:Protein of unknown function (DUF2785)